MKTRIIAAAATLGAGLTFGLTACTGGAHAVTQADMQKWEDATQSDPTWQAVQHEVDGDTTDPQQCALLLHDEGVFQQDHPKAPVGESEWNAALVSMHDEYAKLCQKTPDTTGALNSAGDAAQHLKNFQNQVQARFPGINLNGGK